MLGSDAFRNLARVSQLAVCRLAVTHGEGLHRSRSRSLNQRRDGAGIHAAAEKHAQRHVAHEPRADGLFQPLAAFRDPRFVAAFFHRPRLGNFPIAADDRRGGRFAQAQRQMMARHQLADAGEQRFLAAGIAERQIFGEMRLLKLGRDRGMLEQRLDFRSEGEQFSIPVIIKRLLAHPVSRAEQSAPASIPNGECKHAAELLHAFRRRTAHRREQWSPCRCAWSSDGLLFPGRAANRHG